MMLLVVLGCPDPWLRNGLALVGAVGLLIVGFVVLIAAIEPHLPPIGRE